MKEGLSALKAGGFMATALEMVRTESDGAGTPLEKLCALSSLFSNIVAGVSKARARHE